MEAETESIRSCGGHTRSPAALICTHSQCSESALMCSNYKCECSQGHQKHDAQDLTALKEEMTLKAQALESYLEKCGIERLVGMGIEEIKEIQEEHNIGMQGYHKLLRGLLAGDINEEPTGNDVFEMVEKMEQARIAEEDSEGSPS